mgnify:CR=1 FL=1
MKGECWDGTCEVGDQEPYGRPSDCPDSNPPAPEIDRSWVEVTATCGYTFHPPAVVAETKVQGTDSCVTQYEAAGCTFAGDYGAFSGSLEGFEGTPGYASSHPVIDAMEASIVTLGPVDGPTRYQAGVCFLRLPAGTDIELTLLASCKSEEARDMAVRVIRTLTLSRQRR